MNKTMFEMYRAFTFATIIVAVLTFSYKKGVSAGESRLRARIDSVLEQQSRKASLGGTWDAVSYELSQR